MKWLDSLKRKLFRPDISQSDLVSILREMDSKYPLEMRMLALKKLMDWLRLPVKSSSTAATIPDYIHSRNLRYRFLFQFMEHNAPERLSFVEMLREVFGHGVATRLYCLTGVAENTGFFTELGDRLVQRVLPPIYGEQDLAELFKNIFTEEEDAEWIEQSSSIIFPPLRNLINSHQLSVEGLIQEIDEALIILGAQVASLGLSKGLRRRLRTRKLSESSFVALNKAINSLSQDNDVIVREVALCQMNLTRVRERAEATGVSVDLIYNIERLGALLTRIETLVRIRRRDPVDDIQQTVAFFIGRLIRAEIRRMSIKDFLAEHLQMLTKKIVERAGEKGEHYIATTKEEKSHLFWAAAGAGALTAVTAFLKVGIGHAAFPLLIAWVFYFANYAAGFLLMQRWHLALSSKQPAFMASALSQKFEAFMRTKELSEVISEVRKISYSQYLASVANLLLVVPVVLAFDGLYYLYSGVHYLTAEAGLEVIKNHDLLSSGTVLYAGFTGVLLWLSSVVAGWIENWIVFRNIPQILRESSRLRAMLGKERAQTFAERFAPTMGAAAGNISIAFFLATPLIFGKLSGLPLDIRHVTLATGTISLALIAQPLGYTLLPLMGSMLISIAVMGCLNFGVSFYCSIRMAALARGVPSRYLGIIFRYAFRK